MELWLDLLFGNWIGLLSVLTILIVIGIGVFLAFFFIVRSGEDPPTAAAATHQPDETPVDRDQPLP